MFCGNFRGTISDRGELIIPIFGWGRKKVIIGMWPEGCLFLFPKKEWKIVTGKGKELFFLNREEIRTIFSHTIEGEINNGRIEIPEDLKEQAGLEREVIVAGCDQRIEIWDKKRWEIECERITEDFNLDPR